MRPRPPGPAAPRAGVVSGGGEREAGAVPWVIGAILLLAFGLRAFHLGYGALTGDEAWSMAIASNSSLVELFRSVQATDVHPPLYYVLLHAWTVSIGTTEYAARFLSLGLDLLSIALLVAAARSFFGRRGAVVVALLAAVSPIGVAYAQEVRMYTLLGLLTLSSSLLAYHFLETGRKGAWAGYLAVSAAALFTHYFALFIVAAQDAYFLLRWREHRSYTRRWLGGQLLLVASLLPWFLTNAGGLRAIRSEPANRPPLEAATALIGQGWSGFAAGVTARPEAAAPMAGATALLALLGLAAAWRSHPRLATFLAAYLLVPFAAMVAAASITPYFFARYLLVAVPAHYLLVGRGLTTWRPALPTIALLAALGTGWAFSLQNLYFVPSFAKPDYRSLAAAIEEMARPGDGLVLGSPLGKQIHRYYYHGPLDTGALYDAPGAGPAEAQAYLTMAAGQYSRLWVVPTGMLPLHDPGRASLQWLAEHSYKALDRSYGGYNLYLYAMGDAEPGEGRTMPGLPARFGEALQLEEATVFGARAAPGDVVRLRLAWRSLAATATDYKMSLQMLDGAGRPVAQRDAWPVDGFRPTASWMPDEAITDRMGLWVPPETPPGEYQLRLILYSSGPGLPRLPVHWTGQPSPADGLPLGSVAVASRLEAAEVAARAIPLAADFGGEVRLLGYAVERRPEAPGKANIRLFWQAERRVHQDYTVFVHLLDASGGIVAQSDGPPSGGAYPTSSWEAGEIVEDLRQLEVPTATGPWQLRLGLYYRPTMERLPVQSAGPGETDHITVPLSIGPS